MNTPPRFIIPEDHFVIRSISQVKNICTFLFKNTTINYFHYGRIYKKDGTGFVLTTDDKWTQCYCNNNYPLHVNFICQSGIKNNIFLEAQINPAGQRAFNKFGYDHLLIIAQNYPEYLEICGFGTSKGNNAVSTFYFQNIKMLRLFIKHFKKKGAILLDQANVNKLGFGIKPNSISNFDDLSSCQMQKIFFDGDCMPAILTQRESECLRYLLRLRSAKEIAAVVKTSVSSVETHIARLKKKLNCHCSSQLFDKMEEQGFFMF